LIRRDQDRRSAERELRALIDEGLNSGINNKNVEDIRQGVLKRLKENGKLSA
jgi:hypothetical protein